MRDIDWDIEFSNKGKKMQLALLVECEVITSVDNLVDTATILLPEAIMNQVLNLESKLPRGTEVTIQMGYDGDLKMEFQGFVREIINSDNSLKIICEDALFLFRVGVNDKELIPTSVAKVASYIIAEINTQYTVNCTYDINYEKFTIHQATGYDVLKKIQEETKANIYFDTQKKVLHIHPPYFEKSGEVYYSMQKNIETSSLEFKTNVDTKIEIIVESTDLKGNVQKVNVGTTGGDKVNIKVGAMDKASMLKIANAALRRKNAPAYKGTFDAWLEPFVRPGYSARIKDEDYLNKISWYFVSTVKTNISQSGGVRTITPNIKLS